MDVSVGVVCDLYILQRGGIRKLLRLIRFNIHYFICSHKQIINRLVKFDYYDTGWDGMGQLHFTSEIPKETFPVRLLQYSFHRPSKKYQRETSNGFSVHKMQLLELF